jgi:hypothetical protein
MQNSRSSHAHILTEQKTLELKRNIQIHAAASALRMLDYLLNRRKMAIILKS